MKYQPRHILIVGTSVEGSIVFLPMESNGNGKEKRSAWEMRAGEFVEIAGFDWDAFDGCDTAKTVWLDRKEAVEWLMEKAGVSKSTAYEALKLQDGRFSHLLKQRSDGKIGLVKE